MSKLNVLLISVMMLATCGEAFSPAAILQKQSASSIIGYNNHPATHLFAGFGAGGGGGKKKNKAAKKEQKLKPKQQWDRFSDLKKETSVGVAVRVLGEEGADWLEVGRVKSKEGVSTEVAVAKQRVVIADHSRRLYPLQVSKNTMVEWGYQDDDDESYKAVDVKSVLDGAKEGVEKEVGFEGTADPASGFYCMYKDGKVLDGHQGGKRKVL